MFRDLDKFQRQINKLFEQNFPRKNEEEDIFMRGTWAPAVDIYEDSNAIHLKADLPDVDPNDVEISVENNILNLRGERKFEKEIKEENFYRMERSYGSFQRSFALPRTVDAEKITADFKNGVLRLTMPKREETKPKRIKISPEFEHKGTSFEKRMTEREREPELTGAKK